MALATLAVMAGARLAEPPAARRTRRRSLSRRCGGVLGVASLLLVCATSQASAQAPGLPTASFGKCVGLACLPAGAPFAITEADPSRAERVSGPRQLGRQRHPGFYVFDPPKHPEPAVAYVVPVERFHEAPASVAALPVLEGFDAASVGPNTTLVVFGPQVAELTPSGAAALRSKAASRSTSRRSGSPRARAAAYGDCPGGKFCIFWNTSYINPILFFGVTDWLNLSAYGWDSKADSYRVNKATDALLATYNDGNGSRSCYDSYTASPTIDLVGQLSASVFVSSADSRC